MNAKVTIDVGQRSSGGFVAVPMPYCEITVEMTGQGDEFDRLMQGARSAAESMCRAIGFEELEPAVHIGPHPDPSQPSR